MPDEDKEIKALKAKLEKLADRVRRGWAKLHPVTEAQLAEVNRRLLEKWQQEGIYQAEKGTSKGKSKSKQAKATSARIQKPKAKGHDHGHDQGHSH